MNFHIIISMIIRILIIVIIIIIMILEVGPHFSNVPSFFNPPSSIGTVAIPMIT